VQALDRGLIHEAVCRYFFALDDLSDPDTIGACFTEDARYVSYDHGRQEPALELGRRDLAEVLRAQARAIGDLQLRHHLTGLMFDALDEVSARTRARVLITAQRPTDPAPQLRNTAVCHGSWCKTDSGWLLSRWTVYRGPAADAR
jgi:hypothetical protein